MMTFILPCILIPLRRDIFALMICKERKICDLEALSQVLRLIESLNLEKGIHSSTAAQRRKSALIETLAVRAINICS